VELLDSYKINYLYKHLRKFWLTNFFGQSHGKSLSHQQDLVYKTKNFKIQSQSIGKLNNHSIFEIYALIPNANK